MNVSRRRGFRRVHNRVRVKPDQAEGVLLLPIVSSGAGERTDRDRVIAAENDGKLARFEYCFNFTGELFTRTADLANVFEFFVLFRKTLRPFEAHVAEVAHGVAEPADALGQTRDAQRGWTNIHARHTRAVAERN